MAGIPNSAEPGKEETVYVSGNSWAQKGLNELLVSMQPKERFDFLEKRFWESVTENDDNAAFELLALLKWTYFEVEVDDGKNFETIVPHFMFYLSRIYHLLPISKNDDRTINPTFVQIRARIMEYLLSYLEPVMSRPREAVLDYINLIYNDSGMTYRNKMRPVVQKRIEDFPHESLLRIAAHPKVDGDLRQLFIIALARNVDSDFAKRQVVYEKFFEGIDVLRFSQEGIEKMRFVVHDLYSSAGHHITRMHIPNLQCPCDCFSCKDCKDRTKRSSSNLGHI